MLYNFSFLKCIKTFYAQTNVCVCIYLHGRVCLEPQLHIWAQAAGAQGALCTYCRSRCWVSRLGSCDVQWELFGALIEENRESSILLFIRNWTNGYQECKAFARVMTVPWEVSNALLSYSSEWKSLLPRLSKIESSVSPAVGHFFPSLVHPPLFKEIKCH